MNTGIFFDYPSSEQRAASPDYAFLPHWTHADWTNFFAHCQTLRFHADEVLIAQGSVERAIYLASSGQFEVLAPYQEGQSPYRISVVDMGSVIGEQSFLDEQPAASEVRAITESEAIRFSYDAFEIFAAREPEKAREILFDLGRLLSLRLRTMTAQLYQ